MLSPPAPPMAIVDFDDRVRPFIPAAHRFARRWLGSTALAEEAVQDALTEAYIKLGDLREDTAFGGWFRRIVVKHCDRRTRRARHEVESTAPGADETTPEGVTAEAKAKHQLHEAVERLPAHERVVVAMHYLGEASQTEVAELLGLSSDAVKKRLERARRRLATTVPTVRPKGPRSPLADPVELFLCIRAQDSAGTHAILNRRPDLVDAHERWTDEEALAGQFTLQHGNTPLGAAIAAGWERGVELLIARGANVHQPCACEAGDTPLFVAVQHARPRIVRQLLDAGAATEAANHQGFTPLHLAQYRNRDDISALLLAAGADPAARTRHGMTPADLRLRGFCRLQHRHHGPALVTGIRGIDALAPLERGDRVRVHGAAETGLMTLLAELTLRLSHEHGLRPMWSSWIPQPWMRTELPQMARGYGLEPDLVPASSPGHLPGHLEGRVLVLFGQEGYDARLEAIMASIEVRDGLLIVVDPWAPATRGERVPPALEAPFDANIVTDRGLAARAIYPAIDPDATRSKMKGPGLDDFEQAVRQPFFVCAHDTGWLP